MGKISELLDLCKNYHELWGGSGLGMCASARKAMVRGVITTEECCRIQDYSMRLVQDIDPEAAFLFEALRLDFDYEPDRRQLKAWWEYHISSLKAEGL